MRHPQQGGDGGADGWCLQSGAAEWSVDTGIGPRKEEKSRKKSVHLSVCRSY